MSEDVDGRQTRPADDVGRPDGGAERLTVDGWREIVEIAFHAGWTASSEVDGEEVAAGSQEDDALCQAAWDAFEAREGIGGREAAHGEAPQDAEA